MLFGCIDGDGSDDRKMGYNDCATGPVFNDRLFGMQPFPAAKCRAHCV